MSVAADEGGDSGTAETVRTSSSLVEILLRWPRLTALVAGAIGACGYPPIGLWPLTLLAVGVLAVLLWRASGWKGAAMRGWLFGLAQLTIANNWIATAFTHQAEMPAFLGWFAVPLLCVYLAVYPALAAALAKAVTRNSGVATFSVAFAAFWIITEWMRSWVFTGYPWPPLGLALLGPFDSQGWALLLPFIGTYALSGVAILFAGLLTALLLVRKWLAAGIVAVLVTAGMVFGPSPAPRDSALRYTLVQPNLNQAQINDPRQYEPSFLKLSALSVRENSDMRRIVLWPESGMPDYLRPGYPARYYTATTARADPAFARARIGQVMGENSVLLTGAVDLEIGTVDGQEAAVGAYNSVTALNPGGEIVGSYRKAHLVPYGEYLALRWLLEPLGASRLVAGTLDFIPGPGPRTIDLGAYGRAGVQICYEIVFSGQVVAGGDRPDYIFNPSNDGWFGSWGPPQHLAQARMRAIEEGLPVLRSTTTGISGVIDANGIVRKHLGSGEQDRLEGFVPQANAPTLFARTGNWLPLGWAALLLALSRLAPSLVARWRGRS